MTEEEIRKGLDSLVDRSPISYKKFKMLKDFIEECKDYANLRYENASEYDQSYYLGQCCVLADIIDYIDMNIK